MFLQKAPTSAAAECELRWTGSQQFGGLMIVVKADEKRRDEWNWHDQTGFRRWKLAHKFDAKKLSLSQGPSRRR